MSEWQSPVIAAVELDLWLIEQGVAPSKRLEMVKRFIRVRKSDVESS